MLSFNCFYKISSVLNYASVYATILFDIDDQYRAVLNASTSDDGTQMEVRFGQFEKVLGFIFVTLDTLFRYTWVKLEQPQNAILPIVEQIGKLTVVNAEHSWNAYPPIVTQFGK